MRVYRIYQQDTEGTWHATAVYDSREQALEATNWIDCPTRVVPEEAAS